MCISLYCSHETYHSISMETYIYCCFKISSQQSLGDETISIYMDNENMYMYNSTNLNQEQGTKKFNFSACPSGKL